jgi:hypothetical protein
LGGNGYCAAIKCGGLDELMNFDVFVEQLILGFDVIGIHNNAIDRTHRIASGLVVMTHAFSAFVRIDLINLRTKMNGFIGTFRLAHIAVDARI